MECPHCEETLRVMDREPAPVGTFIRITCPVRTCGKEIVALVREDDLVAQTKAQVRLHAIRAIVAGQLPDFMMTMLGVAATAMMVVFSLAFTTAPLVVVTTTGAAFVMLFGGSILVDFAIGVRGWREALPRPVVDVKTMPIGYRT